MYSPGTPKTPCAFLGINPGPSFLSHGTHGVYVVWSSQFIVPRAI